MIHPTPNPACTGLSRASARIVVAGDPNVLGPNARMNRGKRIRLIKEWRARAKLITRSKLNAGEIRPFQGTVHLSFVIRRGRLLDEDNARSSAALKSICDGLVDAGLIRGDSVKLVRMGEVVQQKHPWCEVEVILEEL